MRAAVVTALTGPSGIGVQEVPEPVGGANEVLIDVHYAGVAFPDVLQSRGAYQALPELPYIPGWEVAGVVRQAAAGFAAGDRVAALPGLGGFAETVSVDPRMVFPLPSNVSFASGAALPLNYLTAHFALRGRTVLRGGETVLVQGAAGGLGTALCGVAAAFGAHVVGVVSSEAKAEVARAAGAQEVVTAADFRAEVRDVTHGRGVDLVLDPVGGDRFVDSLRCLRPGGRLLVLGFTAGSIPSVKVNRLLLTNTSVVGVAVKEYWDLFPDYPQQQWRELAPLVAAGQVVPLVGSEYPLDEASAAVEELASRRALGKVVVRVR